MTWPEVALAGLVVLALTGTWYRYSISKGAVPKALELYLWLTPILTFTALRLRHDRAGLRGLVPAAIVHLTLIAWALRAVYVRTPGHFHARLAGFLLIFGAAVVWLGAITYVGMDLSGIAAKRAEHLFTVGGFLVGGLLSLGGFVALRIVLHERGDALFSQLGLVALVIATVGWILHLAFRATVMVALAQDSAAAPPAWYPPLRLWSGAMYATYMELAYLSAAAYGAGLRKAGLVGPWWGRALVGFSLIFAAGFLVGRSSFPLQVQFMPFAMGMILLRRASVAPAPNPVAIQMSS